MLVSTNSLLFSCSGWVDS